MKLKVITPSASNANDWSNALATDLTFSVEAIVKPLHEVNVLVNGSHPDLVVVETTSDQDFDALEKLALSHPEMEYVLVGNDLSSEALMRAMRAGVREVLPTTASPQSVRDAVQRQLRKRMTKAIPLQAATAKRAPVLAFLSCKGGSGATFTAANTAHLLTEGGERRVALIDLNLQFGDALLFISSARPVSHVADVAKNIDRLDHDFLRSAMVEVSPGLFVLAAPEDPALAADVTAAHVAAILQVASEMFDHVVVDVGRSLTGVTLQALDLADRIYPVLQLSLPYIRDGKRLTEVFRSLDYPASKIHWVVTRYQKNSQITLEDMRRTLAITQVTTLPNQYEVAAASVNQGTPVAEVAPNSPLTRALRDLAHASYARRAPAAEQKPGWFASLRRNAGPQGEAR